MLRLPEPKMSAQKKAGIMARLRKIKTGAVERRF
jgi:hypothetical protein